MKIAIAIGVLILVMNIVFSFSLIFIERKSNNNMGMVVNNDSTSWNRIYYISSSWSKS